MNQIQTDLYRRAKENQHSTIMLCSDPIPESECFVLVHLSSRNPSQLNRTVDELFYNAEYYIQESRLPAYPISAYLRCRDQGVANRRLRELTALYPSTRFIPISISPIRGKREHAGYSFQEIEQISPEYQEQRSESEQTRATFRSALRERCPVSPKPTSTLYSIPVPIQMKKEIKNLSTRQREMMDAGIVQLIQKAIDSSLLEFGGGS